MRTIRLSLLLVRANAQYNITAVENPSPISNFLMPFPRRCF
ncbi:MAG TPA: hypothetical protein VMW06_04870 [Desulfobacterales bacterium]|nr:hypothetical protein [Desulfobacterales bacterium]